MSEQPIVVDGAIAYLDMIRVDCGDGAAMTLPTDKLRHRLRYDHRMSGVEQATALLVAAGALDSYMHLVSGCTLDEALRRLRIMRKALKAINAEHARREGEPQR